MQKELLQINLKNFIKKSIKTKSNSKIPTSKMYSYFCFVYDIEPKFLKIKAFSQEFVLIYKQLNNLELKKSLAKIKNQTYRCFSNIYLEPNQDDLKKVLNINASNASSDTTNDATQHTTPDIISDVSKNTGNDIASDDQSDYINVRPSNTTSDAIYENKNNKKKILNEANEKQNEEIKIWWASEMDKILKNWVAILELDKESRLENNFIATRFLKDNKLHFDTEIFNLQGRFTNKLNAYMRKTHNTKEIKTLDFRGRKPTQTQGIKFKK